MKILILPLKKEKGWTFVELLVSLLIISILITVALINYTTILRRIKNVSCQANLNIIRKQIKVYESIEQTLPPSLEALRPEYIKESTILKCPQSGLDYTYDPNNGTVKCPYPSHTTY